MRASTRRVLTLGVVAATALAWSGCDAKKQTEYVAGVSTQVAVPRDLKAIRLDVSVGGVQLFCRAYRVYDGKVQLPRSLGEFPAQGTPGPDPITVTVSGFTEDFSETSTSDVFDNCTLIAPKVGGTQLDMKTPQGTRIIRRSRQPYVADSVLFLPMPLKYSCFDTKCPDEAMTCKAGLCLDAKVDETKLPKFSEDLISGLGGGCFHASQCFAAGVPAVLVDPNDCTYALPSSASAPPLAMGVPPNPVMSPGDGINVEVTYDGGYNREILDKEPDEGFTIPDPTKPQRFRLAPGLCNLVKGTDGAGHDTAHRITAIRATGLCQAKSPYQPLCADDQLAAMGTPGGVSSNPTPPNGCSAQQLTPAQSALMVLADDTNNSKPFYASANDKEAVTISLSDPAFRKTDIGLTYFPGPTDSCSGFENAVPFANAFLAKDQIFASFEAKAASDGAALNATLEDVGLGAAIADAAMKLQAAYPTANRRALLVIGNRGFDDASTACGHKAIAAAAGAKALGVDTYVVMLARDLEVPGSTVDVPLPVVVPGADAVAVAGSPATAPSPLGAYDARLTGNKGRAQDAFRQIVEDLATCAYDVVPPAVALGADDVLSYSDPVAIPPAQATTYTIPPAAAGTCTKAGDTGNGWGVDATTPSRIRICGAKCDEYKSALKKASAWSLQYKEPALAVPVFAHKKTCAPTP
jgi:hypothetical protein